MPNVVKVQAGYKAQPLSAYLQSARAARRAGDRFPADQQGDGEDEFLRSISTSPCSSRRAGPEEKAIRAQARPHRHRRRARTFDFKDLSPRTQAEVVLGMKEGDDKVDEVLASGVQEHQRLAGRLALRRPRVLQRRLAACAPPPPRAASTATTPSRPCIP